jgi:beta-ribofuranosylaminobenzene 5'-phosphate synthase
MPDDPSPQPLAVEIRTPARLHLGMLSFGVPGVRAFGGVGVMVDRPGVVLRARRANRLEARGPLAERVVAFARAAMEAWQLGSVACGFEVVSVPPSHAGLGSGTQLGLAVAAAVRHLHVPPAAEPAGVPHPHDAPPDPAHHEWVFDIPDAIELARATGRGRRSCVGVYGFSRGGLILEAGRLPDKPAAASGLAGGGEAPAAEFSPMIARVRLPAAWRCLVITARDAVGLHGEAERMAFQRLPPVSAEVTAELSQVALLELLPAAVEGRFTEFAAAIRKYGELAGRPFEEVSAELPHAAATAQLLELLGELGFPGSAQSSWGPTVMACCPTLQAAGDLAESLDRLGIARHHELVIARFDTQGAVLREIE